MSSVLSLATAIALVCAAVTAAFKPTIPFVATTGILAMVMLLLAIRQALSAHRRAAELERLRTELAETNAELDQRVAKRTHELAESQKAVQETADQLAMSEERFALAVKGTTDGLWDWNPQTNEVWYAPRFRELLGYAEHELPNTLDAFNNLLHPDDHDATWGAVREHLDHGVAYDVEYRLKSRDGEYRWFRARAAAQRDGAGKPVRMAGSIQDIHDRKLAGERWQMVVEAAPTAIVIIDDGGRITMSNPAVEKLLGYKPNEVIGLHADSLIPERFRGHKAGRSGLFIKSGDPIAATSRAPVCLHQNGSEIPVHISVNPIETDEGRFVLTSIVDLTERQRADKRFRMAVESAPNAMVMVDGNQNVVLVNAEAERLFGYTREEMMGRSVQHLIPQDHRNDHPLAGAAANQTEGDFLVLRKDGAEVPVEIGLNPIETDDGHFVLAAIVDVTQRKAAQLALLEANEQLHQKNEEMERFVYTVSHDLKSPIVTVLGFIGLFRKKFEAGETDKLIEYIDRIEKGATRMRQSINDLLELSRIGRVPSEPETIDTDILVKQITQEFADRVTAAEASIQIEGELPQIHADRQQVTHLFENLIVNAIKYGCVDPGATISVGTRLVNDEVCFFVRDTGPGIPREFREKVFGLFQRLDNTQEGTGVGLAIVARIMEVHGGRAWIESNPHHPTGATVWVSFPAPPEVAAPKVAVNA